MFDIYWKTKEWVKKLITLVWKWIEEWARYLMKIWLAATEVVVWALVLLGIWVAKITELMADWLKYAYHTVEAVAKKLVEVMQKAGKFVAKAVCDAIFECYGRWKELVTRIWKAVAEAVRDIATTVRDWIYEKTNDMKKAVESMKKWLSKSIWDVYKWMKAKWANAINAIKVIWEVFVDSIGTAIKALYEAWAGVVDLVAALWKKVYDYIF